MGTAYRLDELARQGEVASTTVRLYQAKGGGRNQVVGPT